MTVGRVSLFAGLRRTPQLASDNGVTAIRARLDYELGRVRRYGGSVSLVILRDANGSSNGEWHRFSADVAGSLRDLDSSWLDHDRITLVLPETDTTARAHVIARFHRQAIREGLAIEALASTFPDDGPTSDALLLSVAGGPKA